MKKKAASSFGKGNVTVSTNTPQSNQCSRVESEKSQTCMLANLTTFWLSWLLDSQNNQASLCVNTACSFHVIKWTSVCHLVLQERIVSATGREISNPALAVNTIPPSSLFKPVTWLIQASIFCFWIIIHSLSGICFFMTLICVRDHWFMYSLKRNPQT